MPPSVTTAPSGPRVFLLSPATLSGVRGSRILAGRSSAEFAPALNRGEEAPLGDVYAFISSLYFRGKRAYAEAFARRPDGGEGVYVITPCRGLMPLHAPVDLDLLGLFACEDIDPANPRYAEPLRHTAGWLDMELRRRGEVVLLGSVASERYVEPLLEVFGRRLRIPEAFVGRGDMSRGGLMLRRVESGEELAYVEALSTRRHGPRPPPLDPSS